MRRISTILVTLAVLAIFGVVVYFAFPNIFGSVVVPLPDQFKPLVVKYSAENGISCFLTAATIEQESGWNPNAHSGAGAFGMMQLLRGTFASINALKGYPQGNILDPEANIRAGTALLAYNLAHYGSESNALAAYNGGGGVVGHRWPYETQHYVPSVLRYRELYKSVYPSLCEDKSQPVLTKSNPVPVRVVTPAPTPTVAFPGPPPAAAPAANQSVDINSFWQNLLPSGGQ